MTAIRAGICILLAFSVLAHGAVETWSESVLEIGAALLLILWAALFAAGKVQRILWNPLIWPLAGLSGIGLLQWVAGLSVYPFATKVELLRLLAYLVLFFLAVQAFRSASSVRGFVWFLLAFGFLVSVFGILQQFTFNGKLYWLRELRYGGYPFGPYVNRNHFAGFVELIAPVGLALLVVRGERRDRLPLAVLFTLIPVGALFVAASRGGIASFLIQAVIVGALAWSRPAGARSLAAAAAVFLLAGAVVTWLGVGTALERFASFKANEVPEARRLVMIKDSWHIFLDHPVLGTGLGTLETAYPRYESLYDGLVVNHAHNDYVEALADAGLIGGACCAAFLFLLFRRWLAGVQATREPFFWAVRIGALVACAGILVHGFVDFNLHIPSNALLFLLQASLAGADPDAWLVHK